ncbi:MAG TPA: 4Fe-4S ferredoxin [Desulfobacterales bacterium]|nr:4Fe-4S ferredoxin [Desulfobacterales bacterium]
MVGLSWYGRVIYLLSKVRLAGRCMSEAKKVLVVGGGIAGLTAAWELANLQVEVLLIDQAPFLGGHAAQFACKAIDRCLKCNTCLVEQRLREVVGAPGIDVRLQTRLTGVTRQNGRFQVLLSQGPHYIDANRCTDCGICYERCLGKAEGAIRLAPSHKNHPFYFINPEQCLCDGLGKARQCQSACPEGAIDLDRQDSEITAAVDAVVLATGYVPFDPRQKPQFNFDAYPNMLTGQELERQLRDQGRVLRPSDGQPAQKVAFVQCVGSRDLSLNHTFCSRVCCGYALRLGLRLSHAQPDTKISVFYMDIQNFGKDFDRYLRAANSRFRFIRSLPGDYFPAPEDRIAVHYFEPQQRTVVSETFDLVVLSVGIMPRPENQVLCQMLGLEVNEHGFVINDPAADAAGVVVAGTVEGPRDIAESITHASRAAAQLARHLGVLP